MPTDDTAPPQPAPAACVCGCGGAAHGRGQYAGNTEGERAKHRVHAFRTRAAEDKLRERQLHLRSDALKSLGLATAGLPELTSYFETALGAVAHVASTISDLASACDEAAVVERVRAARQDDQAELSALRLQIEETTAALAQARREASRLQQIAAEADDHAATISQINVTLQDSLAEHQEALKDTTAARDQATSRAMALETENSGLLRLIEQQHVVLTTRGSTPD